MDEAYGYKFLQDKLGCDTHELALRVGKSEAYVLNRLKLNDLAEAVRKDIEDDLLPIGHALEIAKFAPDSQVAILEQVAYRTEQKHNSKTNAWEEVPIKTEPVPLNVLRSKIAEKVLWRLSKTPFDRKATDLREDGLACVNCPSRTGVNGVLFEDGGGKNDSCLDPACWKAKTEVHIKLTRERLAEKAGLKAKDLPLVDTNQYYDCNGVLGREHFVEIVKKKVKSWDDTESNTPCDSSITTIDLSRNNYAKQVEVCLKASNCTIHHKGSASSASSSSSGSKADPKADDGAALERRKRREEIFDIRVSDIVRKRVFRHAAEEFARTFLITGEGSDFLPDLLTKLWLSTPGGGGPDAHTQNLVVKPIMRAITDEEDGFDWYGGRSWGSSQTDAETTAGQEIRKLSERNQKLLLFLIVHGNKGNTYFDRWATQKEVRALAEEYDLDYRTLDAQARVEVAGEKAKKHIDLFKAYLADVEAGKSKAKIPRPFEASWDPRD